MFMVASTEVVVVAVTCRGDGDGEEAEPRGQIVNGLKRVR
jgi:hypothetical protein